MIEHVYFDLAGVIVTSDVLIHDYEAEYTLAVTVTDGRRTSVESFVDVKIKSRYKLKHRTLFDQQRI